jgi:hypothetical protein
VYEVYKVGEDPHWLDGLDLLAEADLRAAVIPHYDNAEGGTHDTRYAYLGERRLAQMEQQLPEGVFVLGVDEHTACTLDLDADTATVTGLGAVTIRRHGRSTRVEAGATVPLQQWRDAADEVVHHWHPAPDSRSVDISPSLTRTDVHKTASPFIDSVVAIGRHFDEALASADARAAVKAVLELDDLMVEWAHETFSTDEEQQAHNALRSMVTRLGETADAGLGDPREAVAPYVDALLEARDRARGEKRFDEADAIRDRLLAAGIVINDTSAGTDWDLPQLA